MLWVSPSYRWSHPEKKEPGRLELADEEEEEEEEEEEPCKVCTSADEERSSCDALVARKRSSYIQVLVRWVCCTPRSVRREPLAPWGQVLRRVSLRYKAARL